MAKQTKLIFTALIIMLVFTILLAIAIGAVPISLSQMLG